MPELGDISYSCNACITAVRGYYQFITKLYLDEGEIVEPPEGGWPSITKESFKDLNKTDEVVELLRHLPYPRLGGRLCNAQGAAYCHFANWSDHGITLADPGPDTGEELRIITESADIFRVVPSHVIGLTSGSRYNPRFLLDTELGVVYWYECPGELRIECLQEIVLDDPYDYAAEDEAEWRAESCAWAITDFFEMLKHQLWKLNSIPTSPWSVIDIFTLKLPDGMAARLQGVFRQHGWPDLERYNKEDCMAVVRDVMVNEYPREAPVEYT